MLQFSELENVFPTWVHGLSSSTGVEELKYIKNKLFSTDFLHVQGVQGQRRTHESLKVQPCKKIRVIDNNLEIDDRILFQSFRRKMSGDSRWVILKIIKNLVKKYKIHNDIIQVVNVMYNGCYKNDKKWKEALYKFIPVRYFENTYVGSHMTSDPDIVNEHPEAFNIRLYIQQRDLENLKGNTDIKMNPPSYDETYTFEMVKN